MAVDTSQMIGVASQLLEDLPVMLQNLQIVTYVLLILFFGSIAVIGYRTYVSFWFRLILRVFFGFLSLLFGVSLKNVFPLFGSGLFSILQLDLIVMGVVSAVVFAVALFLISRAMYPVPTIKRQMEKLSEKLRKAESKPPPKNKAKNPYMIAGIIVIVVMLAATALTFRGFPDFQQDIFSGLGLSAEDFSEMAKSLGDIQSNLPEGAEEMSMECLAALTALAENQQEMTNIINSGEDYSNPSLESSVEQAMGEGALGMKRGTVGGKVVVIAITGTGTCIATESEVCLCSNSS